MAQEKLVPATKNILARLGRTNAGILLDKGSKSLCLVDSGHDAGDGERLLQAAREFCAENFGSEFRVRAILNTHSHADHCGGNAFIQGRTGCQVWATAGEAGGIEDQRLEPSIIWGGSAIPEMRSAFYEGQNSSVTRRLRAGERIPLGSVEVEVVALPGHYLEPAGFLARDLECGRSVFFLGDAIFGRKNMGRHWIPYIYDLDDFRRSLERIAATKSDFFLPSHGDLTTSIDAVAELDLLALLETERAVLRILAEPMTAEALLKEIADINSLEMGVQQCVLIGSTIRAFLSSLYKAGKIKPRMEGNLLLWQAEELPPEKD